MERKKNYGRTIKGELITDELIDKLVREAEEGWDVEKLIREGKAVASPPLTPEASKPGVGGD
ncbi:MAG TPA: hypothetical protein VGV69_00825 [Solirubrobacterales bacterium]|nr:hypothetical protein [Solirubrobacterales bacterium]